MKYIALGGCGAQSAEESESGRDQGQQLDVLRLGVRRHERHMNKIAKLGFGPVIGLLTLTAALTPDFGCTA